MSTLLKGLVYAGVGLVLTLGAIIILTLAVIGGACSEWEKAVPHLLFGLTLALLANVAVHAGIAPEDK